MKHLKTHEGIFKFLKKKKQLTEINTVDIKDICQELIDIGWKIIVIPSWLTQENGSIIATNSNPGIITKSLNWDELKEYPLRLKDYLGK